MKTLTVALFTLISSISFASGFVCQGQGYNVKMYNEVQPSLGTKNPAVLIVSTANGTIARLQGNEIQKSISADTVAYEGNSNAVDTGRFISVHLEVLKQATGVGEFQGMHEARLLINADNGSWTATLACSEYLKD